MRQDILKTQTMAALLVIFIVSSITLSCSSIPLPVKPAEGEVTLAKQVSLSNEAVDDQVLTPAGEKQAFTTPLDLAEGAGDLVSSGVVSKDAALAAGSAYATDEAIAAGSTLLAEGTASAEAIARAEGSSPAKGTATSAISAKVDTVDAVELSLEPPKKKSANGTTSAKLQGAAQLSLLPKEPRPTQKTLSPQEHLLRGIDFLKLGKVVDAEKEFQRVIKIQGKNPTAQNMLRQIRLQPEQYFGTKIVQSRYRVQSGDSFFTIAADYLGNSLEFHILAKLNTREKINDIKVGESIIVPVLDGRSAFAIDPSAGSSSGKGKNVKQGKTNKQISSENNLEYEIAKRYYDQGQYKSSIAVLEANIRNNRKDYKSKDLLVVAYTKYAQFLEKQANLLEAQTVLRKAVDMQPNNKTLKAQMTRVNNQRQAEKEYQAGMTSLSKGKDYEAYLAFEETVALAPDNNMARSQLSRLKPSVTKTLHDKAMILYKNQKIKDAIGNWDRLLMIDPEHELARLYRGRAIELKKRLDKLPKNF